ncbi:MAG: LuxR family transcriptional regulator [Coxiellaceae bacterium]|nr:LuxR family transcriptional regulator [Coxiellaceae bacterium]
MSNNKRIFILGQPGAGKCLLAKTLADKLNWQFINADLGLEYAVGRTLTDIVGEQGSDHYHQNQYDILQSHRDKQMIVVATDAGITGNAACREALADEFVVNLTVSTPVQMARLTAQPKSQLATDMQSLLDQLHQLRDETNEQVAHYSLCSDDNELDEHVLSIIEILSNNSDTDISNKKKQFSDSELTFYNQETHRPVRISTRQAMCLQLLVKGLSSKQIAEKMFISPRTVEDHIANMKRALGCRTSKQLIALYHQ